MFWSDLTVLPLYIAIWNSPISSTFIKDTKGRIWLHLHLLCLPPGYLPVTWRRPGAVGWCKNLQSPAPHPKALCGKVSPSSGCMYRNLGFQEHIREFWQSFGIFSTWLFPTLSSEKSHSEPFLHPLGCRKNTQGPFCGLTVVFCTKKSYCVPGWCDHLEQLGSKIQPDTRGSWRVIHAFLWHVFALIYSSETLNHIGDTFDPFLQLLLPGESLFSLPATVLVLLCAPVGRFSVSRMRAFF